MLMDTDPKSPAPLETLALWSLAAQGGSAWLDGWRPVLRSRKNLLGLGLISEAKELRDGGKRRVKATKIVLTAAGWIWLEGQAGGAIPTRSTAGTEVLAKLLGVLAEFLKANELPLTALWRSRSGPDGASAPPAEAAEAATVKTVAPPPKTAVPTDTELLRVVLSACRRLADASGRIRLAAVRGAFPGLNAGKIDTILLTLQSQGKLVLYPLDNPREIEAADRDAALVIAGFAVHVAYLA